MRRVSVAVLVAMICAGPAMAASNLLQFTSDPGSWIGQGESVSVTPADGYRITGAVYDVSGIVIHVESTRSNPTYRYWYLYIGAPKGSPFVAGFYPDAERYAFASAGHPRLDFYGNYRGVNTLTGNFTVSELAFDTNGDLARFVADFTEYEDGDTTKGIYGHVEYDSGAGGPAGVPALSITGLVLLLGVVLMLGAAISRGTSVSGARA